MLTDKTAPPNGTPFLRPGGMRARALNPPPPLGGRSVPNRNRELTVENLQTPKPQPRPHTLPGQSQNINFFTSEPQFLDFFKFLVHFFLSQKPLNFSSAQNGKKFQNLISERFWLRFWSLFGPLFAPIFSIFHDTPNIAILQQVLIETLVFTSQTLSF